MGRRTWLWLLLVTAGGTTGCVERRFVVTSDPPGALVYRNGTPIGTTPVDDAFVYYGKYNFTLVKDGYETLQVEEKVSAPWYQYPPLDFVSENLWPFKVRDIRRPHYQMVPMQTVSHADVLSRGTELRARGQTIQPFNPESVPPRRQARNTAAPVAAPLPTQPPPVLSSPPPVPAP